MSANPYTSASQSALRQSVHHLHTTTLVTGDGAEYPLACQGCQVTFDEGWAPHIQAKTTLPYDAALAPLLDPRLAPRLRLDAGYGVPGHPDDVHLLADLAVTDRPHQLTPATLEVSAASDETVLQGWSPTADWLFGPEWSAAQAISTIIRTVIPGATILTDPAMAGSFVTDEVMIITVGDEVWSAITDITDRVGGWTHACGDRSWYLGPRPDTAVQSQWIVTPPDIIDATDTLSLSEWANATIVIHQWRDPTAPSGTDAERRVVGYAEVETGPYAVATVGRHCQTIQRKYAIDPDSARASARALVTRAVTRGHATTITAPAAYWLRPGDTISIRLPSGQARVLVASVVFHPHEGLMDLTVRYPETITGGPI